MYLLTTKIHCPDAHANIESYTAATKDTFGSRAVQDLYARMGQAQRIVYSSVNTTNDPNVIESVVLFASEADFNEWFNDPDMTAAREACEKAGYTFTRESQDID